jgi:hypothetical protein
MIAASAALTLSGAPFLGPIGAARVGFVNGSYVLNPSVDDMDNLKEKSEQRLDLVVAGTKSAVMMVESEAYELSEQEMLGAVKFGHDQMQKVIDLIIDLAEKTAKAPFSFSPPDNNVLHKKLISLGGESIRKAFSIVDKLERQTALGEAKQDVMKDLSEEEKDDEQLENCFKKIESEIVRDDILNKGKRIDGRKLDKVRQINFEPCVRGNSLVSEFICLTLSNFLPSILLPLFKISSLTISDSIFLKQFSNCSSSFSSSLRSFITSCFASPRAVCLSSLSTIEKAFLILSPPREISFLCKTLLSGGEKLNGALAVFSARSIISSITFCI